MPGHCGYWFALLLVPSPEGWYTLCRGRRPRLQVENKIREARRADTQDHSLECCLSPPGLMNANLYAPLQPSSLTRGRPPAPYSPGQSPGGEGEPSGWMERT